MIRDHSMIKILILGCLCFCFFISQSLGFDGLAGRLVAKPTTATSQPTTTPIPLQNSFLAQANTTPNASNLSSNKSNPQLLPSAVQLKPFDNSTEPGEFFFITLAPIYDAVGGDKILIATNGSHMDIRKIFVDPHDADRTQLITREILTVEEAIIKYNLSSSEEGTEEIIPDPDPTQTLSATSTRPISSVFTSIILPIILKTTPLTTASPITATTKTSLPSTAIVTQSTKVTTTTIAKQSIVAEIPFNWDMSDYDKVVGDGNSDKSQNDIIVIFTVNNDSVQAGPDLSSTSIADTTPLVSITSATPLTTTIPPPKTYFLSFSVIGGMNYSQDLDDPTSVKHAEYSRIFAQTVKNIYEKKYGPNYVESKEITFSKGSVVVQVPLQVPGDSNITKKELEDEFLKALINSTLPQTNYEINPATIYVSEGAKYMKTRKHFYPAWKATAIVVGLLSFFLLLAVLVVLLLALKRTKEEYSKNPVTGLSYKKRSVMPNKYYANGEEGPDTGGPSVKQLHSTPAVSGFSPKMVGLTGPRKTEGQYSPSSANASKAKSPKSTLASYNSGPNVKFQQPVKRLTSDDIRIIPKDNAEVSPRKLNDVVGNTYDEATYKPDHSKSVDKSKDPIHSEQIYMNVPKSSGNNSQTKNVSNDTNLSAKGKTSQSKSSLKDKKVSEGEDSSPNLSAISPISSGIFKRDFGGNKSNQGSKS